MKDLKEIVKECNLSFDEIKQNFKAEYDSVFNDQKDWLNNVESKTDRLNENYRSDIDYVISCLKNINYQFTEKDTPKLSRFTSQINGIINITNRINNFKEGVKIDYNRTLKLYELFNAIKNVSKFSDLNFRLNKNLDSFIVHFFSVVKHCQDPDNYPIHYKYWKNIFREVLNENDDYDNFCIFYHSIGNPKHISLGAYFGTIGIILAKKITENEIIKKEGDRNYTFIKKKLLNIHYFDLITNYKRNPNYFIIGSKYGQNNDIDVFPKMKEQQVISVGFASNLDLSEFYLAEESEITEYLKEEGQKQNAINALKHFLSIKIGDKVAVKASGSPKGKKGFLSIVGVCEVISNSNGDVYKYDPNGLVQTLNVRYLNTDYSEFELGGYGSTVHKLSNENHIAIIFENHQKEEEMLMVSEPNVPLAKRTENKLAQAICVIGESGVGKTYRVNKTLHNEGHKVLFVIVDNMWQHILFDYSPIDRKYYLTKVGEFIRNAFDDLENNYTIVIDECHKNLEIINDVLLQAVSLKRNNGVRFLALNNLVDKEFEFLPLINGNRVLPTNLGFLFVSSKSEIIEGNDDLRNRIEIIEITKSDQENEDFTIDYLLNKIKREEEGREYTN